MTKLNNLAFKKIEDFNRNKLTGHTYNCPWNHDPQYTHLWNDLEYLKKGGVARCGQPETRSCTHRVEYSIAGFRNTCPIAGRCGTYATPAPLRFSQFNFKSRDVKGKIQLNTVGFSFQHKNNGVNVANGKEAKTWGGKFSKVKVILKRYDNKKNVILDSQIIEKGPSINKYKTVSVNFNLDKIAKNIASQTQRKTFNNNRTLNLSEKDNFAIEIHYYRVENTNPSVIRLKNAKTNVSFTYLEKPSIKLTKSSNTINCSSNQITHTIKVNNEQAFNNLTYQKIPVGFSKPTISTNKNDYTKTYTWKYTKQLTNTKAIITYKTKANNFTAEEKTTITVYKNKIDQVINDLTDPKIINKQIATITSFTKGAKYNPNIHYVSFKNLKKSNSLCYDSIILRIKNKNQNEFMFTYEGNDKIYKCQSSDGQNTTGLNRCFYEQIINKLQCGEAKVTAEFHVNGKLYKTVFLPSIMVASPPYTFKTKITRKQLNSNNEEEVNSTKYIRQASTDDGDDEYEYYITFTRSDKYKDYPGPTVTSFYNETQDDDVITAKRNGYLDYTDEYIKFKINTKEIGTFKVGFYYNDLCKTERHHVFYEFAIIPKHDQQYDDLYIEESELDYTYESIVIRAGDNNRVPIAITDIKEINSYDKIQICFNGGKTNISEIGFGNLTVTNNNNFTIKNLAIELNPLMKDEETGEYDWINLWETIFTDLDSKIFAYNIGLKGRVEVRDDGENFYIVFLELSPGESISVDIPFTYKDECTYYMSLFINGIQLKRDNTNKFLPRLDKVCSEEDYAKFIVTDTMLLELKINNYEEYINIDDYEYLYDNNCNLICQDNECNQCGPFTVLYSIQNIDSISPISDEEYFIRIGHSPELEHIINFNGAYEFNKTEVFSYPLPYAYVKIAVYSKSEYEDEPSITYTLKTDENGEGTFYYTIPSTELQTYNTESLRAHRKFNIIYDGNIQNNPCSLIESSDETTFDKDKFNTNIVIDDDFSQYEPGETVPIHFQLSYDTIPFDNGIYINLNEEPFVDDFKAGRAILIPVTYEGIKNHPNQVLETSIETISKTLTHNYVDKKIYCNIDTRIKVDASLAKTLVQQHEANTLNIIIKNGLKPNKKVKIRIITDGYNIKNVNNITNGTYSVKNSLMYWDIKNMESYEEDRISIDLQATNALRQKNICIKAFDYLHEEE